MRTIVEFGLAIALGTYLSNWLSFLTTYFLQWL
jgi:hypothetical protein